ncbi:hypothetical protein HUB97_12235 [Halorubraceae archaeon YAN]|nr:hypothetical protein [Halorubraceae archaeon YAN]
MSPQLPELSRRSILVGLGAVGVTAAGAGLGTTAFQRDQESLDESQLEMGHVDLAVHYDFFRDQGRRDEPGGIGRSNRGTGTVGISSGGTDVEEKDESDDEYTKKQKVKYNIRDIKPGDMGFLRFCFSIVDNDSYLWSCGEFTDETVGTGGGKAADYIDATLYYCTKDTHKDDPIDPKSVLVSGTLRDVFSALKQGIPLDAEARTAGGSDSTKLPLANRTCFDGSETHKEPNETCLCLKWELPIRSQTTDEETLNNNKVQGAGVKFGLTFTAEQCRYNDGTESPCSDAAYVGK